MLSRSPSAAIAAVSALLLELERQLGADSARDLVADLLAAASLSERVKIWMAAESKLPAKSVPTLRDLAGQVVRLGKRAASEAIELCRVTEPGFAYFDAPDRGCKWLLREAVPSALHARVCGAPAADGASWCREHAAVVFGLK